MISRRARIQGCSNSRAIQAAGFHRAERARARVAGHGRMDMCSPSMAHQEGHLCGCDGFRSNYEISFILTVEVVEDNDEFAILYESH